MVDQCHDVSHVSFVLVLHRDGILPLPFASGPDLPQDAAAEDFDLGEVVIGVGGVAPHRVFQILFVSVQGPPLSGGNFILKMSQKKKKTYDSFTSFAKGKQCEYSIKAVAF